MRNTLGGEVSVTSAEDAAATHFPEAIRTNGMESQAKKALDK